MSTIAEADLDDLYGEETLHPDLVEYVREPSESNLSFSVLQHPLVYSVPYHEQMNKWINRLYSQKTRQLNERPNLSTYIVLHERPYRLQAFIDGMSRAKTNREWWEELSWVWTDSENIWQNLPLWEGLLNSNRSHRQFFMDEAERSALKSMPESLVVYRGCAAGLNEDGLSWTLDKERASWFSKRFARDNKRPKVLKKTVLRDEVFAYLTGRNEQEIIILGK